MLNRRLFLSALAIAAVPTMAFAAKPEIYTGLIDGVGAGGYDVVSYFTDGTPQKGNESIAASYKGATWQFTSEANKNAFEANPAKYAPAFGGYCAYAVAKGYTAKGDPTVWKIVDGRLYLNFNESVQTRWTQDIPGHIASGNANWPKVLE